MEFADINLEDSSDDDLTFLDGNTVSSVTDVPCRFTDHRLSPTNLPSQSSEDSFTSNGGHSHYSHSMSSSGSLSPNAADEINSEESYNSDFNDDPVISRHLEELRTKLYSARKPISVNRFYSIDYSDISDNEPATFYLKSRLRLLKENNRRPHVTLSRFNVADNAEDPASQVFCGKKVNSIYYNMDNETAYERPLEYYEPIVVPPKLYNRIHYDNTRRRLDRFIGEPVHSPLECPQCIDRRETINQKQAQKLFLERAIHRLERGLIESRISLYDPILHIGHLSTMLRSNPQTAWNDVLHNKFRSFRA